MKLLKYPFLSLIGMLMLTFIACSPEKDPKLIESMQMEVDSTQATYDRLANTKQRLGAMMMSMQNLVPEMQEANRSTLDSFQGKINAAINDYKTMDLSEVDRINEMQAAIAAYEEGLMKKTEVKAKFEAFKQAVAGLPAKTDQMDTKIQALETEMLTLLPSDFKSAVNEGNAGQSMPGSGGAGDKTGAQQTVTSPPANAGDAGTPSLVQPQKKQ